MRNAWYRPKPELLRNSLLLVTDFASVSFSTLTVAAFLGACCGSGADECGKVLSLWVLPVTIISCGLFTRLYGGNFVYGGHGVDQVEELKRLTIITLVCFFLMYIIENSHRTPDDFLKLVLMWSVIPTALLLPISRYWLRSLLKHFHYVEVPVLVAGYGLTGKIVLQELLRNRYYGFRVVGILDDNPETCREISGTPYLGKLERAIPIARARRIDYIICCLPLSVLAAQREAWSNTFSRLMLVIDREVFPIAWTYPVNLNGLCAFEINNKLNQQLFRFWKAIMEKLLVVLALLLLLPLGLVLALLIKLSSPGPVFYLAKRLGQNARTIYVVKFRSMYRDADEKLEALLAADPILHAQWQQSFKLDRDPRVTPLGRFLRRSSLDELPQLINVLRGEMALVGPRPIVEEEKRYYQGKFDQIFKVKPGVTGLWQVSGRSDTGYCQRVFLDEYYLSNWSIWLDYFILLKTIKEVLVCKGAR